MMRSCQLAGTGFNFSSWGGKGKAVKGLNIKRRGNERSPRTLDDAGVVKGEGVACETQEETNQKKEAGADGLTGGNKSRKGA